MTVNGTATKTLILLMVTTFAAAVVWRSPAEQWNTAIMIGMIGGLGGFILPMAFGLMNDLTGIAQSCFMLLFLISTVALVWLHV